jgi:hypothetical protein
VLEPAATPFVVPGGYQHLPGPRGDSKVGLAALTRQPLRLRVAPPEHPHRRRRRSNKCLIAAPCIRCACCSLRRAARTLCRLPGAAGLQNLPKIPQPQRPLRRRVWAPRNTSDPPPFKTKPQSCLSAFKTFSSRGPEPGMISEQRVGTGGGVVTEPTSQNDMSRSRAYFHKQWAWSRTAGQLGPMAFPHVTVTLRPVENC